jgi:hypothetical protein
MHRKVSEPLDPERAFDTTALSQQRLQNFEAASNKHDVQQPASEEHSLPLDCQQRILKTWVNALLCPEGETRSLSQDSDGRLLARMKGLLSRIYSTDTALRNVMSQVEAKIDAGKIKPNDPVCYSTVKTICVCFAFPSNSLLIAATGV